MKNLLIIIPGSKNKNVSVLQPVFNKFYSHFGVDVVGKDWAKALKRVMDKNIDTKIFEWNGGISEKKSIIPASKKLKEYIIKQKNYDEIILFAKSLGGVVAENAISEMNDDRIKKIIYVATPHKSSDVKIPKNTEVVNIYSREDNYQRFANRVLYFGKGKQILNNAKNVCIDDVKHSEFNYDKFVNINGRDTKLFDYYKKLILD